MVKKNNVVSFDVKQSDIVNKIEILDGVTSSRSRTVDPVLQCVLFKVESGFMDKEPKVELISTNLQTTITTSVNVSELEHSGGDVKFLVVSDLLHDIVKSFDDDDVLTFTYNVDNGKLVIKSGKSKYTLTTYSEVEKFPDVETLIDETDSVITVETSILEELIDKVIFCTSTDNNLRNLNSILWTTNNENGELVLVGTDGYRLGLTSSEIQTSNSQQVQFLIDLKTMKEIYKLVTTTTEPELKIYVYNSSVVMFDTGDIKIITRTVEDRFPDYTRIININTNINANTTVTVNTDELKEVLKRTSVLSNKSGEKLMLEVTDNVVRFVVRSSDFGEVVDEVDVVNKQGNDLIISFNPKLLNEIIKHIDTGKCEFKFVDSVSPVKISPTNSEFTYYYILMPIRM